MHFGYTDISSPLTSSFHNLVIDVTSAGLSITGDEIQGIVFDAGDGVSHLDLQQRMRISLSEGRRGTVSLSGEAQVRLRSTATGSVFMWEPRASGSAFCLKGSVRGNTVPLADCTLIHVHQTLSGSLGAPSGRGSCGSLTQDIAYIIVLDQDGDSEPARYVFGGFLNAPSESADAAGVLQVAKDRCAAAIYGVMPGDNVTITARNASASVSVESTVLEREGRNLVAVVIITGVLRDGTPFTAEAEASLRLQGRGAQGDVVGMLQLAGSDEPREFEASLTLTELGGDLDDWLKGETSLLSPGTMRVMVGMGQKDAYDGDEAG